MMLFEIDSNECYLSMKIMLEWQHVNFNFEKFNSFLFVFASYNLDWIARASFEAKVGNKKQVLKLFDMAAKCRAEVCFGFKLFFFFFVLTILL